MTLGPRLLIFATAFLAVFSLYAHIFVGLPSGVVTPIIAGLIALCVIVTTALLAVPYAERQFGQTPLRWLSLPFLLVFLVGAAMSTFWAAAGRGLSVQDWGVFAVEVGLAVAMLVHPARSTLLRDIGTVAVFFAIADAGANFLAREGIIQLSEYSGRLDADGLRIRYPGLSGNTHAAGIVAMVAIFRIVDSWQQRPPSFDKVLGLGLVVLLFASMIQIDARRYTDMAAVGIFLALFPLSQLPGVSLLTVGGIAASAIWGTFHNIFDGDSDLRARLMTDGYHVATRHPLLGAGPAYIEPSSIVVSSYQTLSAAGVTESGFLDLSIAYGIAATTALVLSALCVLSAWHHRYTFPTLILLALTTELAFGNALTGFLGAILFFASLGFLMQDECKGAVFQAVDPEEFFYPPFLRERDERLGHVAPRGGMPPS
ncbi:MAG: hypothetical protein JOZ27_07695 [Caulobacteraceae bacterium]|nr:hypothetical protein [Caulobacteraceae bacterium]